MSQSTILVGAGGGGTVGRKTTQCLFMNLFHMPHLKLLSFYLKHSLVSCLPGKQNVVTHRYSGNPLPCVWFTAFLSDFLPTTWSRVLKFSVVCPPRSLFLVATLHFLSQLGGKNGTIVRVWWVLSAVSIQGSASCGLCSNRTALYLASHSWASPRPPEVCLSVRITWPHWSVRIGRKHRACPVSFPTSLRISPTKLLRWLTSSNSSKYRSLTEVGFFLNSIYCKIHLVPPDGMGRTEWTKRGKDRMEYQSPLNAVRKISFCEASVFFWGGGICVYE